MDNNYQQRFKRRKELLNDYKKMESPILPYKNNQESKINPDFKLASEIKTDINGYYSFNPDCINLNSINPDSINLDLINPDLINTNIYVSKEEAKMFLNEFREKYSIDCFNDTMDRCKKEIINNIFNTFGLGSITAMWDKVGGNVDTIHNAREGIYATEEEQKKYENRGEYNSHEYHQDKRYREENAKYSAAKKEGEGVNYMSGEKVKANDDTDVDHVVSAKEIHNDPGRILAGVDGVELANSAYNLKLTKRTLNRMKGCKTVEEFLDKKDKKIKELEAKPDLNPKEKELLEELKNINDEEMKKIDKEIRQKNDNKINKEYYLGEKFLKNTSKQAALEGARMSLQQAVGCIISEFFNLLFDEVIDIYKNGFSINGEGFFNTLKIRISNIGKKLKERWKELASKIVENGAIGFISGFIGSLITTITNMFKTTLKSISRVIREGLCSLFKAIKYLFFPPKNMTFADAWHEAKKLIITAIIASAGVFIEELLEGVAVVPHNLRSILVGSVTTFAITLVVYYIDKRKNDDEAMKAMYEQACKDIDEATINFQQTAVEFNRVANYFNQAANNFYETRKIINHCSNTIDNALCAKMIT